jgi:hypothetical protein
MEPFRFRKTTPEAQKSSSNCPAHHPLRIFIRTKTMETGWSLDPARFFATKNRRPSAKIIRLFFSFPTNIV